MRKIKELISHAKNRGLTGIIKTGTRKIFHRKEDILAFISLDQIPDIECPPNVIIRRATLDDIDELEQLVKKDNYSRNKKDFFEWITRGSSFFLASSENKIIGYVCISLEIPTKYRNIKGINFRNDDSWGRDAFMSSKYRGQKINFPIVAASLKFAKEAGYKRLYTAASPNDISARKAHIKSGHKEIGRIVYYKFLFFKVAIIKTIKNNMKMT